MRKIKMLLPFLLIFSLMTASSAFALHVLASKEPLIELYPRVEGSLVLAQTPDVKFQFNALTMPVHSKASVGLIKSRKIELTSNKITLPFNILVIGDDAFSKTWVLENREKLQKMHFAAFVAEVSSFENLKIMEEQAGFPLIATNVDALTEMLEVKHYPFVYQEGYLWQ